MGTPAQGRVAVKVAGALQGVVFVDGLSAPVGEFRREVARLLGLARQDGSGVKLICSGRTLQDDAKSLADCGVNATTSRVLVTKGAAAGGELAAQEARRGRLEKLKSVVEAMAARGDGQGLTDEREFVLANQAGETVQLAPEDRRALVTGLALHDRGRASMDDGDCASALDELLMADEAFSLCAPSLLESIDNVALLQLDLVWCCYKLQDTARLGVCRERLTRAAAGLRRAHGPNMERARLLHGSVSPAAAVYLRLEVLQGVVAYHMQEREAAAQHLATAQARWQQLQISDESLAQLQGMGFREKEARRALRACAGDVGAATAFIADQREKAAAARQQRRKQRAWLKERAQYGNTAAGRYVDGEKLEGLCQLGCDKALAAEALRQNENDGAMALDVLLDTVKRSALALAIVARDMAQHAPQAQSPSAAAAGGEGGDGGGAGGASTSAAAAAEAAATSAGSRGTAGGYEDSQMTTEVAAAGSSLGHQGAEEQQNTAPDSNDEVEADVAAHVREDPMAAYDIDVEEEGDIITTYMALLASSADVGPGSSCAVASGSGGQ